MKVEIKLTGTAAMLGIAMLVNANVDANKEVQNVSLTDLVNATEANAECVYNEYTNNGGCGSDGYCYWGYHKKDCDSTRG